MNDFDRQIRQWLLRTLRASEGPMPEVTLKMVMRSGFPRVAFTDGDLGNHIRSAEEADLIAGTTDDVAGTVWMLTETGVIKARKL